MTAAASSLPAITAPTEGDPLRDPSLYINREL